jgi:hypothetical protein
MEERVSFSRLGSRSSPEPWTPRLQIVNSELICRYKRNISFLGAIEAE